MWWCIVTITTVGYGDISPRSKFGKIIASLCMVTSFMLLGLPISILSTNFSEQYKEYIRKKQIERGKMMLLRSMKEKSGTTTTNIHEVLVELQKDREYLKENIASVKNLVSEMENRCERMNTAIIKIAQKIQKQ